MRSSWLVFAGCFAACAQGQAGHEQFINPFMADADGGGVFADPSDPGDSPSGDPIAMPDTESPDAGTPAEPDAEPDAGGDTIADAGVSAPDASLDPCTNDEECAGGICQGQVCVATECVDRTTCAADETCQDWRCVVPACGVHTFSYDPKGATYGRVAVAGDFNGWDGARADATMAFDPATLRYHVRLFVGAGNHEYKFLLDGVWKADPENPRSLPPYGNSELVVTCP